MKLEHCNLGLGTMGCHWEKEVSGMATSRDRDSRSTRRCGTLMLTPNTDCEATHHQVGAMAEPLFISRYPPPIRDGMLPSLKNASQLETALARIVASCLEILVMLHPVMPDIGNPEASCKARLNYEKDSGRKASKHLSHPFLICIICSAPGSQTLCFLIAFMFLGLGSDGTNLEEHCQGDEFQVC